MRSRVRPSHGAVTIPNNTNAASDSKQTPDANSLESIDELRAVHRASVQLQHIFLTEEIATETIKILEDVLGYEFAAILLIDETSDRLIPYALSEQGQGSEFVIKDRDYLLERDIRVGYGITGWVAANGVSVRTHDAQNDPRYVGVRSNIRSELCVPMWSHGRVIGVVNVETSKPDAYSESDQRVLEIVATQIAVAIENRRLNQAVGHSQRLEAIGRLTSGIAHDFNNLLTVINGYAEMCLLDPSLNERVRSNLEQIESAGIQASKMTRQMLAFGRKSVLQPEILDPNAEILRLAPMLKRLVAKDVNFSIETGSDVGWIEIDPMQFYQVLTNLVINASESMTDGGKLDIATMKIVTQDSIDSHSGEVPPGTYALIKVSDSGHGFDERVRQSLFEPYFTTKPSGSGLGLAVAHGVIQQSGGKITVSSKVGCGSCFELYLPVVEKPNDVADADRAAPTQSTNTGCVLVVDDEESVRNLVAASVESLGYSVLLASSGAEALTLANDPGLKLDFVISDVVMPEMNGPTLIESIRKIRPNVKTLFISGYPDGNVDGKHQFFEPANLLAKPFTRSTLKRKLSDLKP